MKEKIKKSILLVMLLAMVTSKGLICFTKKEDPAKHQDTWLTIFVHGIISIAPILSLKTMRQIKNDQIQDTIYEAYVTKMRQDKIVCTNQAMQEVGLKKIDTTRTDAIDGCPALAKLFDAQYAWENPNIKNYYYTFGDNICHNVVHCVCDNIANSNY